MMTSSNGNISTLLAICVRNSPVTGEFPAQRPATWSFDVFFEVCMNKRLSKQSWGWWFEMPLGSLWRHINVFHIPHSYLLQSLELPWAWIIFITAGFWLFLHNVWDLLKFSTIEIRAWMINDIHMKMLCNYLSVPLFQTKYINSLHAKFFRGNINHIFTFHVIPPHWYDTGGWNPSSNKTRTYPFYIVNIMAAGVLATQGARTLAAMIMT